MKTKLFGILMVCILIMQSLTFTTVFADATTTTTTTDRVAYDFSDSNATYNVSNVVDGAHDYEIVKGQYGKGKDDGSIRLYSVGGNGSTKYLSLDTSKTPIASDGQYTHVSLQFLNEDGHSTIGVTLAYYLKDNTTQKTGKQFLSQPRTASVWHQTRILPNASSKVNVNSTYGAWHQLDLYFSSTNQADTVAFYDGKKQTSLNASNWHNESSKPSDGDIGRVYSVSISHNIKSASPYKASAVQLDNIVVERVDSVPATVDFDYRGDHFNFDDGMRIGEKGHYEIGYYHSAESYGTRFNNYHSVATTGATGVVFESVSLHSIENGVFGRPAGDNSLHTVIPSDASDSAKKALYYSPGPRNYKPGDYVHLTFSMALNKACVTGLKSVGTFFSDSSELGPWLVQISKSGSVQMLQESLDINLQCQKWYKFDMVFKVGENGTNIDSYIDGVKYLDNFLWLVDEGNNAYMTSLGTLLFGGQLDSDFYVDDVACAVFTADTLHNPAEGYTLSAAGTKAYVNNNADIVGITSDADFASTSELFINSDYATVISGDGIKLPGGKLTNNTWVKSSNGFGGGIYYNVGYKSDKLAIGDIVYDADEKTLKSQAEVGFDIREDFNASVPAYPTSGTVIIALYEGDELVACTPYTYDNLSEANPAEAVIYNVDSIAGKTMKVFVFDSTDGITPLIVNKAQ